MSRFNPSPQFAQSLKDKVVVITGGASGIGAAAVEILCQRGARVVFADVKAEDGEKLEQKLSSTNLKFVKTDVTKYGDIVELFDVALKTYGRVDCAVSNAGVMEQGNWVDPELSLEDIKQVPDARTLNVNLLGPLYFARVAAVYLRQGETKDDDKSIILTSSIAAFKETPGMPVYMSSKHGVMGLMRGLRVQLPETTNIRINAICPWFVDTIMTAGISTQWRKAGLPINTPIGVAEIITGLACEKGMNGKAIYVEGNRGWEIEENIDRLEPQWLGEEQSKVLARGQALMGSGEFWQA